ncbi:hypothetical protein LJR225_004379 [Phenylobacterium sp. LjRoot225]|uniref:hypothetical protein n=1 Tax=Phenylobacterium sp. LjRoot225 TaxID=3342285 RepID=UPI003ECC7C14
MRSAILILAAAAALAGPAQAQIFARPRPAQAGPPPGTPPAEADIWPFPAPDPQSWWDDKRPMPSEAADPLGGRRLPRGQRLPVIDNGVEAATYRLWGLMPLQWQLLRGDEMILEVWVRPARNVRQSIVRVTVRGDGRGFVQGRAGYACCEAGVGRRIGFDAELAPEATQSFVVLRGHPMWSTPREVQQVHDASTTDVVCVSGVGYDLTLLTRSGSRSLHRACDDVVVGQAADALEPALRSALGHDPRFDILFRSRIDFGPERQAYLDFTGAGGVLKAAPTSRAQPPGAEPEPQPEAP